MEPLPPAFDAARYRALNPEVGALDDAAARAHYEAEGRARGLVASPMALREGVLKRIAAAPSVLEIGPFCRPLLTGAHVEYLDVLDAPALRARALEHGLDPSGCPETIHHVGDIAQVGRRYAAVVSSHAIEHQPDLVRHLREVERILEPDGAFYLLVPDKRYCFDHFLPESSIAAILQAHRERRRVHSLASVIEHVALTTHNDCGRHWAGDHGDPGAGRAGRVATALRNYEAAAGGYLDVHAWQFTPGSFRETIATLAALGLIGLEAAEVYDTAHGRNEFAAVLRPDPATARRLQAAATGVAVIALQTADPVHYAPMLAVTQPNVAEFCRRHGFRYEAFVGLKRGVHPWQATYNRIPMLSALLAEGFAGWALYLDADAWVAALDFDLAGYLAGHGDRAAIFATAGVTDARWDVNAGVALINLGHPLGRRLVERWQAGFDALSDGALRAAEVWLDADNDQDLLHRLLREDPALGEAVLVEDMAFMNAPDAHFVRQLVRARAPDFAARLRIIADEVAAAARAGGAAVPAPVAAAVLDERWRWRLHRPPGHEPALIEAAVPAPRRDLADAAIAQWHAQRAPCAGRAWPPLPPRVAADFRAALDRADTATVAAELAALGKARIAEGVLGGLRQHERARDAEFARRLALWTQDKLVSLAEAVGALPAELAEAGRWDVNAHVPPAELFGMVRAALGVDLAPPAHIGGHLGIAAGDGVVLHLRMLDAIHAAWRLRQLAGTLGDAVQVAEIGGGAGLTALYAARFGLAGYALIDRPEMGVVQRYVLGDRDGVAILGTDGLAGDGAGRLDILFNADSLPALGREAALGCLRDARRLGARAFLSINQEAELPGQVAVPALVAEAGGWRLAARHPHWLRAGYVETMWEPA